MVEKQFEIKAYSKAEMATMYQVSIGTFLKWIHAVISEDRKDCKIFTPVEVKMIVDKIGEP